MAEAKEIVEQTYDNVAEWYLEWVQKQHSPRERYTARLLARAPPSPHVLDLGCGPGVPITRLLLDSGARVVANDLSPKLLAMAKTRCPEATLVPGDMTALSFPPQSFDGIVSFYAVFHLPRDEQRTMLARICTWLKPGALFVCNLATFDADEMHGEFFGYGMFWSSYGVEANKRMIADAGLALVDVEICEAGDGGLDEDDPDYGAQFMWVVARAAGDDRSAQDTRGLYSPMRPAAE